MLRQLRVRGYKSLLRCEVEFSPLSVILGPNGAGKSNLLDLLHLLSRLATAETVREAFEGHRGRPLEAFHSAKGFGAAAYQELLGKDRLSFSVECDLELHPRIMDDINRSLEEREKIVETKVPYTRVSERLLRYSLVIAIHPKSGELFVIDESLRPLKQDLQPKADSVRKPFFEREGGNSENRRFVARIERQAHPRYFDGMRPRTLLSELTDPVYHPHVVAAARELASWRVYYVEPNQVRTEIGVQAADEPGRDGRLLAAYFYALKQRSPATLKGIVKNLRELVAGFHDLDVRVRDGLLELVALQADGTEFPGRLLSEGTLRLMCILGIGVAPSPPALVGYEEPENGVNPARLGHIAQMLRTAVEQREDGPQFILTTHSPLVCELLPERLIICDWEAGRGTTFRSLDIPADTLFFKDELVRALDGGTAALPRIPDRLL